MINVKLTTVGACERSRWDASDIDRENRGGVAASKRGPLASFKTPRYRGTAKVDLQNQFIGTAWNVERQSRCWHSHHGEWIDQKDCSKWVNAENSVCSKLCSQPESAASW